MSSMESTKPGIAVVTGASSGIGRAASIALNEAGWTVVLVARRKEALEETVRMMGEKKQARTTIVVADVGKEEEVRHVFEVVRRDFGRLDLLFNNAGMGSFRAKIDEIPLADFKQMMDVNVTACFICAQEAIRIMKAQNPKGGRIINNGSISAYVPRVKSAPYTMSKHAILGLTKCIALDHREDNIACSQIDIGNANSGIHGTTSMLQACGEELQEKQFHVDYVGQSIVYMAGLPLGVNVLNQTLMATTMPFVGRG